MIRKKLLLVCVMLLVGCTAIGETDQKTTSEEKGTPTIAAVTPTLEMPAEWDLIFFSDSSGRDVAAKYATYIEKEHGVTVNVRDMTTDRLSIGRVLEMLEKHEKLKESTDRRNWIDYIAEAEIVVIYGNPEDSKSEINPGDWMCVSRPYHVENCALETFDKYIEDLSTFYEKVFELRDGQPTIIRTFTPYVPLYVVWEGESIFAECLQCWLNYVAAFRTAAQKYNVPAAPVFEAFNGENHTEDPREKGYIGHDGLHTTAEGSQVIADVLHSMGYAITNPPGK